MTLANLLFTPLGSVELDLQAFDCGRESVNKFFLEEAQDYQDELFEMEYRNWNVEKDGPLETRLMFRDMILLKRPSIRKA